ncbi:hypothetical protein BS17DRAFT_480236 [Gyrodon lividus]|nr:hypothetical protein BS17DRAFT_480236 [Gyrodon lividus]
MLLASFLLVIQDYIRENLPRGGAPTVISFAKAVISRSLSPNGQRDADERFGSIRSPGEKSILYCPWVNAYPTSCRDFISSYSCQLGPYPVLHSSRSREKLQDKYLDALPVGFADDAPNLTVFVGTIVWILLCRFPERFSHSHELWMGLVRALKETHLLPEPAGVQLALRNYLKRLNLGPHSLRLRYLDECFDDDQFLDDYCCTAYSAIIMYVKSKDLGPTFEGCPKWHSVYVMATRGSASNSDSSSVVSISPARSPSFSEKDLHHGDDDYLLHPHPPATTLSPPGGVVSPVSHFRSPPLVGQAVTDSSTFPPLFYDASLAPEDRQSRFDVWIRDLVAVASHAGLRFPKNLLSLVVLPETFIALPAFSSSNGTNNDQETPARLTQPCGILSSNPGLDLEGVT